MPSFTPYYKVNDKIFYHKIDAVLHANLTNSDVTWHFHDETFNSVNWKIEPSTSLKEFYKLRAAQIRENFDYVVILCSGGADSTNVLRSFLDNNIFPDEIIASAPLEGLQNYQFNDQDTSHFNTMSETKYAQLPLMDEISKTYPKIKITLHDYFKDMLEYQSEEWLYLCEDWVHPSSLARYRFERHIHLRNLAESGKKIAFVYGIDKPVLMIGSNYQSLLLLISDLTVNVQRPPFQEKFPNVENILFYWTPELPQMMVKQAHRVGKWIFQKENRQALKYLAVYDRVMKTSYIENRMRHSKYERAIIPCIYPNSKKVFQAEKPSSLFLGEHDGWFYKLHKNTMLHQMMVSDSINFLKKLDSKYLNKPRSGLLTYTNYFNLGPLTNFCNDKDTIKTLIDVPENLIDFYLEI
jgi:hypothetical protein